MEGNIKKKGGVFMTEGDSKLRYQVYEYGGPDECPFGINNNGIIGIMESGSNPHFAGDKRSVSVFVNMGIREVRAFNVGGGIPPKSLETQSFPEGEISQLEAVKLGLQMYQRHT